MGPRESSSQVQRASRPEAERTHESPWSHNVNINIISSFVVNYFIKSCDICSKGKKMIKGALTPLGSKGPVGRSSKGPDSKGNLSDANTSGKETDSRSSTPSLQGKTESSSEIYANF